MHNAVEIPFNGRARRFFEEQAVARDLALFVRSPRIRELRRSDAPLPGAAAIARRFPARVVSLPPPGALPPPGEIGVWSDSDDVIVASRRAASGRRLYVTLSAGRIGRHNLSSLASSSDLGGRPRVEPRARPR